MGGASHARRRTVAWDDPREVHARNRARSGLAMAEATIGGGEPVAPMWSLLDFEMVEAGEGFAVFAGTPAEFHYGPNGSVAHSLALALLDSANGRAVNSVLPAGKRAITVKLDLDLTAPMTVDTGRVLCRAELRHQGRQIMIGEGAITGERDGALYARGRAIFAVTAY